MVREMDNIGLCAVFVQECGFELVPHQPCSPDLGFYYQKLLFLSIEEKKKTKKKKKRAYWDPFYSDCDIIAVVDQDTIFYKEGFVYFTTTGLNVQKLEETMLKNTCQASQNMGKYT